MVKLTTRDLWDELARTGSLLLKVENQREFERLRNNLAQTRMKVVRDNPSNPLHLQSKYKDGQAQFTLMKGKLSVHKRPTREYNVELIK